MKTSEQLNELAEALAIAQGQFTSPEKNRDVDVESDRAKYSFAYATLDAVLDMVRPHLTANGLSIVQTVDEEPAPLPEAPHNAIPRLTTRLLHKSGQWIEGSLRMQIERAGNQGVGSAITYMRRYGVMAMLGICSATDDDDGNAGDGNRAQYRDRAPRQQYQGRQEERREAPKAQTGAPSGGTTSTKPTPSIAAAATPAASGTTDLRPQVFDVFHPKACCEAWFRNIAKLIGERCAAAVWKVTNTDWELRFGTLRDIHLACETIRKVLGEKPGSDLIGSTTSNFSWDEEGVQQIRKELVKASLGEVPAGKGN